MTANFPTSTAEERQRECVWRGRQLLVAHFSGTSPFDWEERPYGLWRIRRRTLLRDPSFSGYGWRYVVLRRDKHLMLEVPAELVDRAHDADLVEREIRNIIDRDFS